MIYLAVAGGVILLMYLGHAVNSALESFKRAQAFIRETQDEFRKE
jgi:hypothetical protein